MQVEKKYKLSKIISVDVASGKEPLNLKFKANKLDESNKSDFIGPGIYLISYKAEVIYIGKYQPLNRGNILLDRWIRHLETITMRGFRVGFGKCKNKKTKFESIQRIQDMHPLLTEIENLYKYNCEQRFRDTGIVTSMNRIAFAGNNWNDFRYANDSGILSNFELRLFRLDDLDSEMKAKDCVTEIEKKLLYKFKPRINKEYHDKDHSVIRGQNTIEKIVAELKEIVKLYQPARLSHCTVLTQSEHNTAE
ncbi:MAG: hypothetical protein ABL920_00110 [Methylotenera sp.]